MSALTVLVTGGTGTVGAGVVRALLRRGHHVLGLSRSAESAERLREMGAQAMPGTLSQLTWQDAVAESQAVIHCGMDWSAPSGSDRAVVDWLLPQLRGRTFIYTMGTWCYGPGEFSESSPLQRGHGWDWLIDNGEAVLTAPDVRSMVVHPPLVYDLDAASGSCSGWLRRMVDELRAEGKVRIVGSPSRRQAVGHADDVGDLYALVLESGEAGRSYNAGCIACASGEMALAAARFAGEPPPALEVLEAEAARAAFGDGALGMDMDQVMRSPASHELGWLAKSTRLPMH